MANQDEEVRRQLLSHGDDGKAARHTLFFFYDGDIKGLEKAALSNGFAVKRTSESTGLIIEKTLPVDELSFAPVSAKMEKWAEEFGCEYDGWECELLSH